MTFPHLATPQKFHWKSSVILDMTDEGCMYAARYPSQLHTSKHYELVPVSAYSVPVKKVYCLLFLDMFYHAKILQPDVGRPAKRAIPRSNSGLRFAFQGTSDSSRKSPLASRRLKERGTSRCLLKICFCDIISRTQIPKWTCAAGAHPVLIVHCMSPHDCPLHSCAKK